VNCREISSAFFYLCVWWPNKENFSAEKLFYFYFIETWPS